MDTNEPIVVEAQMLIRRPAAEVFEAIVNPKITTRFWFTKSSGQLKLGEKVRWDWEMFGVGDELTVKEFELDQRILVEWSGDKTSVEWRFEAREDNTTLVKISNWGFSDNYIESLPAVVDAKGGYTMVLAGLKAWLEQGIELNLIRDQFPDEFPI
ncbi:MAG: SRPBCC family protein [Chloroflexota bacterium]